MCVCVCVHRACARARRGPPRHERSPVVSSHFELYKRALLVGPCRRVSKVFGSSFWVYYNATAPCARARGPPARGRRARLLYSPVRGPEVIVGPLCTGRLRAARAARPPATV